MSDFDLITAKLAEIGQTTASCLVTGDATACLIIRANGKHTVAVNFACADTYAACGDPQSAFQVEHVQGSNIAVATLYFRGTGDVFATIDRALDFVTTETPVPL